VSDVRLPNLASPELRARVRAAIDTLGLREAARIIGVSREALLGVIAGTGSQRGTIVLCDQRTPLLATEQRSPEPERAA
jgi:hypothetical protein